MAEYLGVIPEATPHLQGLRRIDPAPRQLPVYGYQSPAPPVDALAQREERSVSSWTAAEMVAVAVAVAVAVYALWSARR